MPTPGAGAGPTELGAEVAAVAERAVQAVPGRAPSRPGATPLRPVTEDGLDHAIDRLGNQARSLARELEPLISTYTSRTAKWLRSAIIVALVVLVAWLLLRVLVETSLLDWVGERIDNLVEQSAGPPVDPLAST